VESLVCGAEGLVKSVTVLRKQREHAGERRHCGSVQHPIVIPSTMSRLATPDRPLSPLTKLRRQISAKKTEIEVVEKKQRFLLGGDPVPELPDLVIPTNLDDYRQLLLRVGFEMGDLNREVAQLEERLTQAERDAKIRISRCDCV
jgi:hypothetical protein